MVVDERPNDKRREHLRKRVRERDDPHSKSRKFRLENRQHHSEKRRSYERIIEIFFKHGF